MTRPAAAASSVRRAMILAAGLGTRLLPVTNHVAKPLLPVLGRPLLEIIVDRLCRAGVTTFIFNSHHFADQVAGFVEELFAHERFASCQATVCHEPEILGTGGALWNARSLLAEDGSFLLHNGDILSNLSLADLVADHDREGALATLALVDWPAINSVLLGEDGAVRDIGGRLEVADDGDPARKSAGSTGEVPPGGHRALTCPGEVPPGGHRPPPCPAEVPPGGAPATALPGQSAPRGHRPLTYTGVAVLSRELLDLLPSGVSSLIDTLLAAMRQHPDCVRGHVLQDCYWNDLGTLGRYLDAHADLLLHRRVMLRGIEPPAGPIRLDPGAQIAPSVKLAGFVSVGRNTCIEANANLRDCVLLDGATVGEGESHHRTVLGSGWSVSEAQNEVAQIELCRRAGWSGDLRAARLTGHGSDRAFWRLGEGGRTAILMQTTAVDPEFERFLAIGTFLHEEQLGGPEILAVDKGARAVLLEDLGDDTLYRLVLGETGVSSPTTGPAATPVTATIANTDLYRQVIDLLVELQTRGTVAAARCPLATGRRFDYDTLRGETDYFRRRFLGDFARVPAAERDALDDEFHRLATAVLAQPVVLMHRDFQSQNILIKDGCVRLVDFQGMRRGPLAYDLMSLLRDSYVALDPSLRADLEDHYRRRLADRGGPALDREELRVMAILAGLQRNLQALGAFAFLSLVKGKEWFGDYVPLGLRHVVEGLRDLRESGAAPGPLERLEDIVAKVAASAKSAVEGAGEGAPEGSPSRASDRDS